MTDLVELKAHVDAATGPDQRLEFDLVRVLISTSEAYLHRAYRVDRYNLTSSLDAAIALVERLLPGAEIRLQITPDSTNATIAIDTFTEEGTQIAPGRSAPLAMCSVLLSALIAKQAAPSVHGAR